MTNSADGGKQPSVLDDLEWKEGPLVYRREKKAPARRARAKCRKAALRAVIVDLKASVRDAQNRRDRLRRDAVHVADAIRLVKAEIAEKSRLLAELEDLAK